jgi:inner membrane protein involved in colicin E2 resistance
MVKRIAAILFIFVCTAAAWMVLGSTILIRTHDASSALSGVVASNWGTAQIQFPPTASFEQVSLEREEVAEAGKKTVRTVEKRTPVYLPLERTRANATIDLEHRQKGLLWYSTYKVAFEGTYAFRNDSGEDRVVHFTFPFPAEQSIYDDLTFLLDGQPLSFTTEKNCIRGTASLAKDQTATLQARYRSQGLGRWGYAFGSDVARAKDFELKVATNFKAIDFPDNTLSPTEKRETPQGWELQWSYRSLLSGYQIGIAMPEKLQPGPLAGQISFFAPVSLFFFFFLMWIITTLREIELHPMNYFFLAAAFFAFHLLLAYLVDHISIHAAFAISSVVSIALVVSYLRLVVGIRFAAVEAGLAQLIYLVLFSYAFFFKGYTGLAVTIGSILTLFVVMQMTGRIRWAEKFAGKLA